MKEGKKSDKRMISKKRMKGWRWDGESGRVKNGSVTLIESLGAEVDRRMMDGGG